METKGHPDARVVWKRWWEEYRPTIPARVEVLHRQWKGAIDQGKSAEAEQLYGAMRDLGVLALPPVVDAISQGEQGLVPLVSDLTDGAVKADASKEQVITWWADNKAKWTLPEESKPEAAPTPPAPK